jgi:release factor glutamine methyltransferase
VIVSNPPYIATSEIPGLPIEVRDHDPHVALDGGIDGLDAMRIIVSDLDRVLADGGAAFVEIGFGQGPALATLAQASGFVCSFRRDIAAIERVAILSRQDGHLGASG